MLSLSSIKPTDHASLVVNTMICINNISRLITLGMYSHHLFPPFFYIPCMLLHHGKGVEISVPTSLMNIVLLYDWNIYSDFGSVFGISL